MTTTVCGTPRMLVTGLLLAGMPELPLESTRSVRRFTWLVDVFYDDRVKMIVAAEAQPDELFTGDGGAKTAAAEFALTASRLTEMQTAQYLQAERRRETDTSGKVQGIPA